MLSARQSQRLCSTGRACQREWLHLSEQQAIQPCRQPCCLTHATNSGHYCAQSDRQHCPSPMTALCSAASLNHCIIQSSRQDSLVGSPL